MQLQLDGWDAYVDDLNAKGSVDAAWLLQDILDGDPNATPFAHPCFWAGFVLQGEA